MMHQFLFAGRAFLHDQTQVLRSAVEEILARGRLPGPATAKQWRRALDCPQQELEREYVRLFLSPQGAVCPPWQSVQVEPHQLMGEAHHSALRWYRNYGVEPAAETEPADHIGLLLIFYGHLLSCGAPPQQLAAFYREHLAWIPDFCRRLERKTRLDFYRLLARLCRRLMAAVEKLHRESATADRPKQQRRQMATAAP